VRRDLRSHPPSAIFVVLKLEPGSIEFIFEG
jgi:hypothetical protein